MTRPISSPNYRTERILYPELLNGKCPACEQSVQFCYADNGKVVICLHEQIHQIVNLYQCNNPQCALFGKRFNPAPRFDYSGRHFGKDVFLYIAHEFLKRKQNPEEIYARITEDEGTDISLDTVSRICDDILLLKANQIDQRTRDILQNRPDVVMAMDGQDPGKLKICLWLFTDVLSGRLLAVRHFESLDYTELYRTIESIKQDLKIRIIGFLSDKQSLIVKCLETYYPAIPHQYCQFHFLSNHWRFLSALDSGLYMTLRKVIESQYIHCTSKSAAVEFEGIGNHSPREVFASVDRDLQRMLKITTKKFEKLRGLWLYTTLKGYVEEGRRTYASLDSTYRFSIILRKLIDELAEALAQSESLFQEITEAFHWFKELQEILGKKELRKVERMQQMDETYKKIWKKVLKCHPRSTVESLKTLQIGKKLPVWKVLAEWVRLWQSYLPGLFKYYEFPLDFRTNVEQERAFGWEKQQLYARIGKTDVSQMVVSRGPYYLRLFYSETDEIGEDPTKFIENGILRTLRGELQQMIQKTSEGWLVETPIFEGFDIAQRSYYVRA